MRKREQRGQSRSGLSKGGPEVRWEVKGFRLKGGFPCCFQMRTLERVCIEHDPEEGDRHYDTGGREELEF